MKFDTKFSRAATRVKDKDYTCCGSRIKDEYQLRIVDDEETLVKVGESNLYDYIQSHKDSVDIHKILERCALLDDYSYLNRMPTEFMDVTMMPKNLAEAHAQIQDAKNLFDRMPVSIKQAYDNNYVQFLTDLGSKRFENLVGEFLNSIKKDDVKNEVVENES